MNKNQKLQVLLALFFLAYIIFLLFIPGWETSKILSIIGSAFAILAMCLSYRAEEKKKNNTDN